MNRENPDFKGLSKLQEIDQKLYQIEKCIGDQKKLMNFIGERSLDEKVTEFSNVLAGSRREEESSKPSLLKRTKLFVSKLEDLTEKAKRLTGNSMKEEDLFNVLLWISL